MAVAPVTDPAIAGRPDGLQALADRCVQCGLCLPHCPTYQLDRHEAESPRGRIAAWRALDAGLIAAGAPTDSHLDHCLGCRACERACPAGVDYGRILVAGRRAQRQRRRPPARQRLLEELVLRPRLLRALLGLWRVLSSLLPARLHPLPAPPRPPEVPATHGPGDGDDAASPVALFTGCITDRYDAPTRRSLARLLDAAGIATLEPAGQVCCGALHAHAGDPDTATTLAARQREAFAGHVRACTTATGCHAALSEALSGGTRVIDPLVLLADHADALQWRATVQHVAVQRPCTGQSVAGHEAALARLLAAVPGLHVSWLPAACCGAAGSHMLVYPDRARALRQPLVDAARATGATTLLSSNIGCRLHLAGAAGMPVRHPIDFLAEHVA